MWEDAANKQGGRWVITLNKSSKNDLDNLWLDVVSYRQFHSKYICLIEMSFSCFV